MRKIPFFNMEFPKVLTSEEEKRIIERLPDPEAQNQLVERNLRLVIYICKEYINNHIVGPENFDDLFSIGTLGLIKASRTFSPERKTVFPTYAVKCIQNEIRMYLNKNRKKEKTEKHLDDIIATDNNNKLCLIDILSDKNSILEHYEELDMISRLLTDMINTYSQQERAVFYYAISGKNQAEIGKLISTSQSYVSRLLKRVFNKNKKLNKKLQYVKRISVDYLGDEIVLVTFHKKHFNTELYSFLKNNQHKYHYLLKSYKDRIKVSGFMQDIFNLLAELSRLALI